MLKIKNINNLLKWIMAAVMVLPLLIITVAAAAPERTQAADGAGWYFSHIQFILSKDSRGSFMGDGGYTDKVAGTYYDKI